MVSKTTIDDLAGMVNRGFQGVDKEFKNVYNRFDQVDEKLDRIENHLVVYLNASWKYGISSYF